MGIAKELIDRFFFFFLKKQGFFSGKGIFLWGFYVRWRFVFLKKQGFFLFKGGEFFYGVCMCGGVDWVWNFETWDEEIWM